MMTRKLSVSVMLGVLMSIAGCDGTATTAASDRLQETSAGAAMRESGRPEPAAATFQVGPGGTFLAQASGEEEVPAVETRARGQAIFRLSADGTELDYRLIVANIQNVTQAHIHVAPPGANGPVVAWLYPSAPPAQLIEGRFDGVLATGTISADDLVGLLAGQGLEALLAVLRAGDAYVNVHTSQHPPGEIRGQIRSPGS